MNRHGQHGYAMAALIVAMSIMAILLAAVMPVWRQTIRREREAELEFRLGQYARAINLFQRKAGPGVLPPDLDVLIDQKYLRKKYKDPITGGEFELLRVNSANSPGGQQQSGAGQRPGQAAATTVGGIMGVASKSTAASLKLFNGRSHYNEWQSQLVVQRSNVAGMGANGAGGVGGAQNGRGGNNQNPQGGGIGGNGTGGRGGTGTGGGRQGGGAQGGSPQGQRQGGGGFQFPGGGRGR